MTEHTGSSRVRRGSGNVFRDLKLPLADEVLAKAELARQIADIMRANELTQAECARLLGIDQPKVSALVRGRLSGFSTDRLLRFVTALGQDVDILIRHKKARRVRGRIRVRKATPS